MRYIDADRLIKLLKEQKVKETGAYTKGINSGLNVAKCIINDNTVQSPMAYDVEKVVEQLEEAIADTTDTETGLGARWAYTGAIEIVKQGGVGTDDVCEWKSDYKIISDKYKRVTGCGYEFYDLHHAVPFKHCPYCGKKILARSDS